MVQSNVLPGLLVQNQNLFSLHQESNAVNLLHFQLLYNAKLIVKILLRRAEQRFYIQDAISSIRQCAHIINIAEVFYKDYCGLVFVCSGEDCIIDDAPKVWVNKLGLL